MEQRLSTKLFCFQQAMSSDISVMQVASADRQKANISADREEEKSAKNAATPRSQSAVWSRRTQADPGGARRHPASLSAAKKQT